MAFGCFTIIAGDFQPGTDHQVAGKNLLLRNEGRWFREKIPLSAIAELAGASEETVLRIGGALGWGIAGEVLFGPAGLLAGAIAGGMGRDVTFVGSLSDGRKFLAVAPSGVYRQMQSGLLAGQFDRSRQRLNGGAVSRSAPPSKRGSLSEILTILCVAGFIVSMAAATNTGFTGFVLAMISTIFYLLPISLSMMRRTLIIFFVIGVIVMIFSIPEGKPFGAFSALFTASFFIMRLCLNEIKNRWRRAQEIERSVQELGNQTVVLLQIAKINGAMQRRKREIISRYLLENTLLAGGSRSPEDLEAFLHTQEDFGSPVLRQAIARLAVSPADLRARLVATAEAVIAASETVSETERQDVDALKAALGV